LCKPGQELSTQKPPTKSKDWDFLRVRRCGGLETLVLSSREKERCAFFLRSRGSRTKRFGTGRVRLKPRARKA